jgi:predicted glycoside hydrolase/deacetylase ChbG (UPF0249 family)
MPLPGPDAALRPNCAADDWGMSPGVNAGILALCEAGMVRSVSLFANLAHSGLDLDRLLRVSGLRFSLHLNFTFGRPLSGAGEVGSLCGPDGNFRGPAVFWRRALLGRLPAGELRLEALRQVRRLKSLGVPLTGVEGHHHSHLAPSVLAALAPALREEGITWARLPVDRAHLPSWAAGAVFRRWQLSSPAARGGGLELRPVRYLRLAEARSGACAGKVFAADGLPAIVHPALTDDLGGMEHRDPYRGGRVEEFRRLMRLAGRRPAKESV